MNIKGGDIILHATGITKNYLFQLHNQINDANRE